MQIGLQWGNFQSGAVALALVAMVAMSRKREVLGALLLGFVVLAKLFPGVLLLVLAARRQWRALSLTLGAMAAWSALAVAVLGPEPFVDFVHFHLPRMASGEAFGMLHVPFVAALNHSVYGLPLKLRFFGIDHGSFASGATLAWLYTIVPCAAALVLGRRLGPISAWTRLRSPQTHEIPGRIPSSRSSPLLRRWASWPWPYSLRGRCSRCKRRN
jgi:alpha-1,2-mannosyltransferase